MVIFQIPCDYRNQASDYTPDHLCVCQLVPLLPANQRCANAQEENPGSENQDDQILRCPSTVLHPPPL